MIACSTIVRRRVARESGPDAVSARCRSSPAVLSFVRIGRVVPPKNCECSLATASVVGRSRAPMSLHRRGGLRANRHLTEVNVAGSLRSANDVRFLRFDAEGSNVTPTSIGHSSAH